MSSEHRTYALDAINYDAGEGGSGGSGGGVGAGNPALTVLGGPMAIARAPADMGARVYVRVRGPAGQTAWFADNPEALRQPPNLGTLPQAFTLEVGDWAEFWIEPTEYLYALASISPNVPGGAPGTVVFAAVTVSFFEPQRRGARIVQQGAYTDGGDAGEQGAGGPFWRR